MSFADKFDGADGVKNVFAEQTPATDPTQEIIGQKEHPSLDDPHEIELSEQIKNASNDELIQIINDPGMSEDVVNLATTKLLKSNPDFEELGLSLGDIKYQSAKDRIEKFWLHNAHTE